ncbi:EndoU domain-containing protein [Tenacibaculum ovolyticum]|uniref:EndoU domain-containing protein n=1 Tax=Tenacibaculum ovolyticum TaxID=104270 RepID=UPI00040D3329|nr:EndoU domain-containing protein [Tenacibaculum ovolyticum]
MHAHEYGSKHFKHKTNFKDLVVFSDVQQNKIKETTVPSPSMYVEIEKGVKSPGVWFLHINSTLSGEYGDFFLQENPTPLGEVMGSFDYGISPENTAFIESFYDFTLGSFSYYKINKKYYIKIWGDIVKSDAFFDIQNSSKSKSKEEISIEYNAFATVFISEDGAQLLQAYEAVKKVAAHEVVIFIERSSGSNLFGTVFRIKKGKNVNTLLETNRIRIAEIARAYGVDIIANKLSKMIEQELNKTKESNFYLVLATGGRMVRWGADVTFSNSSKFLKSTGEEIGKLKLGDNYWKTEIEGKENSKYNPLLPKLKINESFSSEKIANSIYKTYVTPLEGVVTSFAERFNKHWLFKELMPFKVDYITKLLQYIPSVVKEFLDGVKEHLQNNYDFINGLLVGLINSIIDFFKSFFDILAILIDVLNGVVQAGKFFEKPGHYLRLLAEGFENLLDLVASVFTVENLKALGQFLISMPIVTAKLLLGLFTKASNAKITIDPGAIGYYLGFLVGFIASEVVMFFATGGTGTIAKGVKAVFKSYKELLKMATRTLVKTAKITVNTFLTIIQKLKEFIKNLPKHLNTLKGWIDEFVDKLVKVTRAFSDDAYVLFEKLGVTVKKVPQQPVLASGVPIPIGDNLYALVKDGKEIFRGTKKEVDELVKKLDELSDLDAKKYLDEVSGLKNLRKVALEKYLNKFDINLFNHISGDVAIETIKIVFRDVSYVGTAGQGGHWVNKFLEITKVTHPSGVVKLADLLNDIPFKAKIKIKSLRGRKFPKRAESTMFPKNWNEQRIKEEIAYVYENTFVKSLGKKVRLITDKFDKFEGVTTAGFSVRIEVDGLGNVMNAYPLI